MGSPTTERRLHGACLAILSIALVGTVWCIPYLPTNDGPESIFAAHMENHYGDAGTVYREFFAPTLQFAGLGFTALFGPLEAWLGWQRGLQVALSIILLVQAWGVVLLARTVAPGRGALAFVGFPLALTWSFYMGFFAFSIASGLGLFALALGVRWKEPSGVERAVLAFMLFATGLAHVFAAALTGVVLACVSVARAPRGRRLFELAGTALVGLPLMLLVLLAVVVARRASTGLAGGDAFLFRPLGEMLATWPRTLAPGPLWRAVIVAALVVAASVYAAVRALRRDASAVDVGLTIAGVTFVAASVFAPMHVPAWQCFSQRFVLLGVAAIVATLPLERLSPARLRLATFAIALASLLSLVATYPFHLRLAASFADVVAALDAPVRRARILLPVSLEPAGASPDDPGRHDVPYVAPLAHIGPLFATSQGGMSAYTFASNGATWPFVYRDDASPLPPIPSIPRYFQPMRWPEFQTDLAMRHGLEDDLATYGMAFEGVVLTAARADDVAHWLDRGYVADFARGSVLLAHFEPCTLRVRAPAEVDVDVGVGAMTILRDRRVDASGELLLRDAPCGHVWVRPHANVDGVTSRCVDGELLAHATRAGADVSCSAMGATRGR